MSANVLSTKGIMINESNSFVTIITGLFSLVPVIGKPLSCRRKTHNISWKGKNNIILMNYKLNIFLIIKNRYNLI